MKTLQKNLCSLWLGFIHLIIDFLMPASIKRLILLSTVYVYLNNKGILRTESDIKLKEYLNGFTKCDSYDFGTLFASTIWDKTNLVAEMEKRRCQIKCDDKGCLVNTTIDDLSTTVVRSSPEWLRYNTDQFKQDLQVMLDGAKIA